MSQKTRKKSSKSGSGRPTAKAGGAKAGTTARTVAKKSGASVASKRATPAKKTSARGPKRPAPKAAAAKKSAVIGKKQPAKATAAVQSIPALNAGDSAPAFSLPRDGGQVVSLADYAGRKLVLFFYPRANTPGCTLEAIAFSHLADDFAAAGTAVLGVSADSVTAQEKFRDKHDLTVPLVSDEKRGMLEAYGVWREKSLYGKTFMGIVRTTVLIDGNGRIIRVWRSVKVDGHADAVLAAAQAA